MNNLKSTLYAITAELSKFIKLNFIIGSKAAFFSLSQCSSPLIGLLGGTQSSTIVFVIRTLLTVIFGTFGLLTSLLYHVPTFCGALYLSSNSRILKILLPVTCIFLFLIHPTGKLVPLYALYWVAPVIISLINSRVIFFNCLSSTLVTHAFGTIIWLYSNLLDVNSIKQLSLVVWAERLIFAVIMTALYYTIVYIQELIKNYNTLKLRTISFESNQ